MDDDDLSKSVEQLTGLLLCPFCGDEPQELGMLGKSLVRHYPHTDWMTPECWNTRADVAAKGNVEQALVELREMFPKASWRELRFVEEAGLIIKVAFNGYTTDYSKTFTAGTLEEAMQKVREWKAESKKDEQLG